MSTTHAVGDTVALTDRSLRHVLRSPDTIITTAVTPVALMLLLTYVFGGAVHDGPTSSYVDYLLPGILLITVASGVAYTAYRLFLDLQGGIVERLQSMPIARPSVLWAHVLTSLAANLVSVVLVVGVALLMGFRTGATVGAWLAVTGVVVLFTLTLHRIRVFEPELPKAGGPTEVIDDTTAFIQASVDGTYHWRVGTHGAKETVTAAELGARLMHYKQSVPVPRVLVRSDPHARLRAAVFVLDEVHRAGITQVAIETRTSETGS